MRITSTNICGSDLHMYEGRTNLEPGMVIGHENLGEVTEVGPGVARTRVCLPVQHRLWVLPQLRGRPHGVLPDGAPGPPDGRRRLRIRRNGAVLGRAG